MSIAERVRAILNAAVSSGEELGCQCSLWRDGVWLADECAGWCDSSHTRQVTPETLFAVFSTGKAVLSLAALRMIAAGRLSLSTRVSELWQEFSGNGKEQATIAEVMSHTTGLFCLPRVESPADLVNWELMCTRLAAMKPAWPSGTRTKYQAFTYSWLLGEPLSRLEGCDIRTLLQRQVLSPLGLTESCVFGLTAEAEVAAAWPVRAPDLLPPMPPRPTFWNPTENMLKVSAVRRACLPAFNCTASAHALAVLGAAMLDGKFLPEELRREATQLRRPAGQAIPSEPGYWELFGYGFLLYAAEPARGRVFGHGGYGGTELLVDQSTKTVLAFTKNRLSTAQRTRDALRALAGMDI